MSAAEIETLIRAALPDAQVLVEDLAGDGDHYAAQIVSESFRKWCSRRWAAAWAARFTHWPSKPQCRNRSFSR